MRQGALRELKFTWPGWKKQGWTIDQLPDFADLAEPEKPSGEHPAAAVTHDDSTLGLRLNGRRGDDFVVTVRASRPAPKSGTTFPLSLPQLAGSTMTGGVLVAADAENVKSNLEPRAETVVRSIAPNGATLWVPPIRFEVCGKWRCGSIRPRPTSTRR